MDMKKYGIAMRGWGICCCCAIIAGQGTVAAETDALWLDQVWEAHLLVRAQQEAGNPLLQEAVYREALRQESVSPAVMEGLARLYRAQGETTLALAALAYARLYELSDIHPEWDEAAQRQALLDGPMQPPDDEREAYQQGLDTAATLIKESRFLEAEQNLRALLRSHPRDPQLLLDLGTVYALTGDWPMFTMLYAGFAELYPDNADIANNLRFGLEQMPHQQESSHAITPHP